MAPSVSHTAAATAVALLCLSSRSDSFAVPKVEPSTQLGSFGKTTSLGAEPRISSGPRMNSATESSSTLTFAASVAVGCAVGAAQSRMPMRNTKTPEETYATVIEGGKARLSMSVRDVVLQGIITGFYIGFGGVLCSTVGGSLPPTILPGIQRFMFGAVGFPLSIFLTTIAGGQGFTPNLAVMGTALFRRGSSEETRSKEMGQMIKNLCLAYGGNAIGLITIAFLANLGHLPAVPAAIEIAKHKVEMTFGQVVFRGILGAWLIGLAVWTAQAAHNVVGKFVTIWLCISTYVMCQYEHCLANIFFVPCAIFAGAPITWDTFINASLIPSTIGNIIGGLVMLTGSYRFVYGPKFNYSDDKAAVPEAAPQKVIPQAAPAPAVAAPAAAPAAAAPADSSAALQEAMTILQSLKDTVAKSEADISAALGGAAPAAAPAAVPAAAPVAAAPVAAPAPAAPAGAVSQADLAAAQKNAQLLTWAANKLAGEGSPLAAGATQRAQQAEAQYQALKAQSGELQGA